MTSIAEYWNASVLRTFDEDFPLLMPRWGYALSAFILFLIGFFGFFLNLMVILLMLKDRQLWTPLNIILFNLVCSDFSVSVLGNPFTLISALFHRWIFGHTMCVIYGFFMSLLGIVSITSLTVLSFERYVIVTRPLSSRHLTSKGAMLLIVFIWAYSLALTTPPLFGWGNYVNEAANISCSVNWHEQSRNTLTYILFLFAMGQIVPLAVISFSYVNIIRTMKQNSQRLGRVNRKEAKVTGMVFVMIISFTIAWTPYSIFALMEQFATNGIIISPGAGVIPALVAKSSICYDPLIYVGMNTQFRQSIKRLFGIHKTRGGQTQLERACDNTVLSPVHKEKRIPVTDDISEEPRNDVNQPSPKSPDLCIIQENKTNSYERSDETLSDNDSGNNKKSDTLNATYLPLNDSSPFPKVLNSRRQSFGKTSNKNSQVTRDIIRNVYGNHAFDHTSEDENESKKDNAYYRGEKSITHSYSLDLIGVKPDNKRRKLSVEIKLEGLSQFRGLFKNNVVSKIIDQDTNDDGDKLKIFSCPIDKSDSC